jgi:hypothetical protein
MTTFTSTGSGGNDLWSNAGNWSPGGGPPGSVDVRPHTPNSGWNIAGVGDFNGDRIEDAFWHSPPD